MSTVGTGFGYSYDAAGRKSTETDTFAIGGGQTFGYDDAGRLTAWTAGVAATQSWSLTKVGDWLSTTRDGVAVPRVNTAVHEAIQVGPNILSYDVQGNLTKDEQGTALAWDPENRLTRALVTRDASATGFGSTAAYRYDALGRRIAKTVDGRATFFLPSGAQTVVEIQRPALPATQAAIDGAEADGTLANLALPPASGGVLAGSVTRINFQPATAATPAGFLRDTGKLSGVRTNGLTYGWSTESSTQAVIRHGAVPLPEFDTFIQTQPDAGGSASWSIALPDGSYPVIVVAGDALSTEQTNHLVIGGVAMTDATPSAPPTYQAGNFDGYAVQATVTGGALSIAPGAGAYHAKLCFVEIGQAGTAINQAARDRLAALVAKANAETGASPQPTQVVKEYVYGGYVDEVLCYVTGTGAQAQRYFPHYNHLYSVAALTNAAGQVVERFTYDAYGKQKITDASGNVTRAKSSVGWDRGFTGYIADNETGLLHARERQYSPTLGRFVGRDPKGYVDGFSVYNAYFVPGSLDPSGTEDCCCCCVEDLSIDFAGVKLIDDAQNWGHEFQTTIKLKYIVDPKIKSDCVLKWFERTDKPYTPTMIANGAMKWNDMTKDPATAPSFANSWGKRKKPCPGTESVIDTDPPSIPKAWKTASSTLQFAITVESGKDCPCSIKSITLFVTQFLSIKDGKGEKQSFTPGGVQGPWP